MNKNIFRNLRFKLIQTNIRLDSIGVSFPKKNKNFSMHSVCDPRLHLFAHFFIHPVFAINNKTNAVCFEIFTPFFIYDVIIKKENVFELRPLHLHHIVNTPNKDLSEMIW